MKFKEYRQAEAIYKMVLSERISDATRGHVFHSLGLILMEMNDHAEALRHINEAIAIESRIRAENSVELTTLYNNRAMIYQRNKDFQRALTDYQSVLQRRRETLPPDDLNIAASFHMLGSIHTELNQLDKALTFYLQELEIYRKHGLVFTPELDSNYENIAAVYFSLGNYLEAEKFADLCLKVREKLFANDFLALAELLKRSAEIAEKREKWDKAERFYRKALDLLPAEHDKRVAICQKLGEMSKHQRDFPQAIAFYREAMKIEQKNSGKYHPNLYTIYREMSSLLKKIGQADEAKAYGEKAAKIKSRR